MTISSSPAAEGTIASALLTIDSLSKRYGEQTALDDVMKAKEIKIAIPVLKGHVRDTDATITVTGADGTPEQKVLKAEITLAIAFEG